MLAKQGLAAAPKTNWSVYSDLMAMPESQFNKVDLKVHLKDLAPAEFKQLTMMQKKGKPSQVTTPYTMLKSAVKGMDQFDPKENGEEASARFNNLVASFKDWSAATLVSSSCTVAS